MSRFEVSIPEGAFTWESQFRQYEPIGEPGISYFAGDVSSGFPGQPPIHCLLYRSERGIVIGILNYYEADYHPWEKAGNVNVWVNPRRQRQGIATALVQEAMRRWDIDLDKQRFTPSGKAFIEQFVKEVE